jgi:hypothetical protein
LEGYGDGEQTILLLPTWTVVHTRFWKLPSTDRSKPTEQPAPQLSSPT